MSEEMKNNETTETAKAAGKIPKKKPVALIAAAVVILLAIAVGIGIYNTPANRMSRQLDLGNKYLENEQYEEAVLAFERVIAIDDRCMEAYTGAIEAYLGKGSQEELEAFYDRTLAVLAELDEEFVAQNMEAVVEIYLATDKVYETDPQKAAQVLEEGLAKTGENEEIRDHLIKDYLKAAENETDAKKAAQILEDALAKVGENQEIKDNLVKYYLKAAKDAAVADSYEEALTIYDRLLELDSTNAEIIKDLCSCLNKYIDFLMESGQYDIIRALAEKYGNVAADVDFDAILARIEEPSAEESEPSSEEEQAAVDNEWFTGLYSALLQDDYKTVMEILGGLENVREKCATCEYTEWAFWDYETAYRMTMDDEQVMGIIVYAFEDGYQEINAFVSYQPGDGFDYTGYGDHCVVMYGDGTYAYIKDGNQVISTNSGQGSFTMEEDDIWAVWHM